MSLLDRGPHTVLVELAQPGDAWTKQTYAPPVSMRCKITPLRAEDAAALGLDTALRVTARAWPGGPRSRITWQGRYWYQRGETLSHTTSPRTRHDTATLVSNAAEVK